MASQHPKPPAAQRGPQAAQREPRAAQRQRPPAIQPTDEQRAVLADPHRRVIVEANAGAAKTTTLALRIADALARGAAPTQILALTYTDTAVTALRQALERIGVAAPSRSRLRIHSFDDFCARCLQRIEDPGTARLDTPEQLRPKLLAALDAMLDNPHERHAPALALHGRGEAMVEGLLASFTWLKGSLQLQLEASERELTPALADELGHDYTTLRAFRSYEQLRRGRHLDRFDFRAPGDATYDLANTLLDEDRLFGDEHPLHADLRWVMVDEMHDTNRAMFTVLIHLLRHNVEASFLGVGDRDQVLHNVAGADAAFMGATFEREIGTASRPVLTASYRFGRQLAEPVGRLAGKAYASRGARDTALRLVGCDGPADQAWQIADTIQRLAASGLAASGIAVLLRQPHQSVDLENYLLDRGVDYETAGFAPYLARPEVLFVRALIAYARGGFDAVDGVEARSRMLRALLLFTNSFVGADRDDPEAQRRLERSGIEHVAASPSLLPSFVDNQVLRNADEATRRCIGAATACLRDDGDVRHLSRFVELLRPEQIASRVMVRKVDIEQVAANVRGLIRSAAGFDSIDSFVDALQQRELRQGSMRRSERLLLASIEAVKGLEFEQVLIPGLGAGEFAVGGDAVNNRNLLYVGMTRARQGLALFYDKARPSRYLFEAGLLQASGAGA